MQNNLFIQRLRILTSQGKVAYDEHFHEGVNIIRGQNSSGKSTIIRFIFYVLGGCYSGFVPEALKCHLVMAEILINGNTLLTIGRKIERMGDGRVNPKAPMYIFFGNMDESIDRRNRSKWMKYGYSMSTQTQSFSNILFKFMGLPEFKADSNITVHQILRLIYIDQESPLGSLFFYEPFDNELTRETVAELLMGLYDGNLSKAKLEKLDVEKNIADTKSEIKFTGKFFADPKTKSSKFLNEEIERLLKEINSISSKVQRLRINKIKSESSKAKVKKEYEGYKEKIVRLRKEIDSQQTQIQDTEYEIQDSKYFLEALKKKKKAVERSISTRKYFTNLHLEYCPECLAKLSDDVPEGHCRLCKSPIDNNNGLNQANRIRLELDYQIRESQSLLEENEKSLKERKAKHRSLNIDLKTTQKLYDDAVNNVRSTQDEEIDQLLESKGFYDGLIRQYKTLLENAEKYEQLEAELVKLEKRESELSRYIMAVESKIKNRRQIVERKISENGIYLLKHDEDRQDEFKNVSNFVVDYKQNLTTISGQRIKLSASSEFYKKLSARFALFLSSLQIDTMLYPRLMFSDNMEDKGMEENRSKNFQNVVVNRLQELSSSRKPHIPYQLIFATSNIADELNTPEYTIGEFYTKDNKSLKNVDF